MSDSKTIVKREIPIAPIVLLVTVGFIVAKCAGALTWPWLWVLAPLWITVAAYTAVVVSALVLVVAISLIEAATE